VRVQGRHHNNSGRAGFLVGARRLGCIRSLLTSPACPQAAAVSGSWAGPAMHMEPPRSWRRAPTGALWLWAPLGTVARRSPRRPWKGSRRRSTKASSPWSGSATRVSGSTFALRCRFVRCAPLRPGGRRPRGRLRAAPRALSACYRRGLVHRNVQRENVLVAFRVDREKPAYVLCDFAFFPAAARARGAPRLLWRDEGLRRARSIARAVRTPSDMFSAGCLFFAVVTRDLPFGASRAADAGGGRTGTVGGRSGGCCSHSCTVAFTPAVTHACIFPLTPAVASRCCPQVSIDPLAQAR
jgi:hypothetical protein